MREMYPKSKTVRSCGLSQGDKDQLVEAVMAEMGIDMSTHEPQVLHNFDPKAFDLVIAFTKSASEAANAYFEAGHAEIMYWPLPSPEEGSLDIRGIMNNYRALREVIKARLLSKFGPAEV